MKKLTYAVEYKGQYWYVKGWTEMKPEATLAPLMLAKAEDIIHITKEDIEDVVNCHVWNYNRKL